MDDSGRRRGALVLLLLLLLLLLPPALLLALPPAHRVALRRTAGGGLPPLLVVPLPPPRPRLVPVLFLLLEEAPIVGRGGGPPLPLPLITSPDRLRIDASVAADNGRRGGVPALIPLAVAVAFAAAGAVPEGEDRDGQRAWEPDDEDDSRPLPPGPPSCELRLPRLDRLPVLDRSPKLQPDDEERLRPLPPLLLPLPAPEPAEPAEPVELHRGRRVAFLLRWHSFRRSFRALYRASRSSMVRQVSSMEFSSTTAIIVGVVSSVFNEGQCPKPSEVPIGSSGGGDNEREPVAVAVGRKSASSMAFASCWVVEVDTRSFGRLATLTLPIEPRAKNRFCDL